MSQRKRKKDRGKASAVGANDALETLVNQFADPLVFLRELVQNSLDASSTQVDVEFDYDDKRGLGCIRVFDNGEGMNEAIIDRYLLTLFSSTKENDLTKIGKFGVGFVSIFAIKPDLVVLETGQSGESWRIIFHTDRSYEKLRLPGPVEGTEIALYKTMTEAEFDDIRRRAADTVRYWCKYAEAEISVDEQPVGEDFGLQAALAVSHREPGTELVVGFAPPRQAIDGERYFLAGREAATALSPLVGFYNRGLTLIEASEPPDLEARGNRFMAGLSARLKSRYLEHTLTRDNVRQDENYVKAMKLMRARVAADLQPRLVQHLQALAANASGVGGNPGAPGLALALLYARLPSMQLHERAAQATILPALHGGPVSVRQVRETRSPTGTLLWASEKNRVTELLHRQGVPVLLDLPEVLAHLHVIGVLEDDDDHMFVPSSGYVSSNLVSAEPVELDDVYRTCLSQVQEWLDVARVKVERVVAGNLAYPGSPIGEKLFLRQVEAFGLTRPGHDDRPTWLGGARDIVVNVSHPLVRNCLRLAPSKPTLAAQILTQAIATEDECAVERTVDLARRAMTR